MNESVSPVLHPGSSRSSNQGPVRLSVKGVRPAGGVDAPRGVTAQKGGSQGMSARAIDEYLLLLNHRSSIFYPK